LVLLLNETRAKFAHTTGDMDLHLFSGWQNEHGVTGW